jgi:hypothetical protein
MVQEKGPRGCFPLIAFTRTDTAITSGDKGFQTMANVQFVAATRGDRRRPESLRADGWGRSDLSGRVLDIIPIPGHQTASIAI